MLLHATDPNMCAQLASVLPLQPCLYPNSFNTCLDLRQLQARPFPALSLACAVGALDARTLNICRPRPFPYLRLNFYLRGVADLGLLLVVCLALRLFFLL